MDDLFYLICVAINAIPSLNVRGLYPKMLFALVNINPVRGGLLAGCEKVDESAGLIKSFGK